MCGIAGKIDFDGPVDEALLHRMCAAMEHRGPDERGVLVREGAGLGAQRLAIIDVAGGHQPVVNEDETVAVALNGEIYNFAELREDLIRRGHRFRSRVDTEVLVHLYEEHGADLVHHLRGMFAFAIWDAPRRRLVCARDRPGKKPLFWARRGSRFWFASEIAALLQDPAIERVVEPRAIEAYLALQYVPHPLCALRGVHKLPPASVMVVTEEGERISTYWSLDYEPKLDGVAREELEERIRDALRRATRRRLISEVPLGAFLSGGIDSSAVVAAMAEDSTEPVRTFSISFSDSEYDETRYARMVAERYATEHHEFRVEPEAVSIMPKLARHYGEPFADPAAIPTFHLAELASRHVTVALNGDGGDETFGGYPRYHWPDAPAHLGRLPGPLRRLAPAAARLAGRPRRAGDRRDRIAHLGADLAIGSAERYAGWVSAFGADARRRVLTPEFAGALGGWRADDVITAAWAASPARDRVDRMLDTDVRTYLPGNGLAKTDIATMAYSVEGRSPFLDHEVMELAAAIPAEFKVGPSGGKLILASALRGIVPGAILDRPKMGFIVPLRRWLREELRELPGQFLLDRIALDRGYFRRRELERMMREHREGTFDHSLRLWVLLQLEAWHREIVDATPTAAAVPSL